MHSYIDELNQFVALAVQCVRKFVQFLALLFQCIEKIIQFLAFLFAFIGMAALFSTMAIIVTNVVIRIWWKPLDGTYEIVEILGALLLSLGVAYCAVKKGHVSVDVLVEQFPKEIQHIIDTITNLIASVFIFAIGREAIRQAERVMNRGGRTDHLGIPIYPFYYLVAFGLLILGLVLFFRSMSVFSQSVLFRKIKSLGKLTARRFSHGLTRGGGR